MTFKTRIKGFARLFMLSLKLTFSRRYLFYLLGTVVWLGVVVLWNFKQEGGNEPLGAVNVLNGILALPGTILVVILSMQMVSYERENRTLEVLFCLPGSEYKVWLLKAVTIYLAVFVDMLALSALSYVFIADFNVLTMAFHAMFPLFVFGALTLLLSLIFKSGNAAGMLAALILVFVFVTNEGWSRTRYFPFLNPFNPLSDLDPFEWFAVVLQNRILMVGIASLFLFLSLRMLTSRERLL